MIVRRPADWKTKETGLAQKRIVLSGGSTGIGRATMRMLAAEGAHVLFFGRHRESVARALDDAVNLPGNVYGYIADQANDRDLQRIFDQAQEVMGGVDILINNASIAAGGLLDASLEDIRYAIDTNVGGYLACARLAAKSMAQRGGGHIVNIGSMSAEVREGGSTLYVATKGAIQAFSEALRKELADDNIKVSLIEPGRVGSDMPDTSPRQQRSAQRRGDALTAEDIAECIHYCLTQPQRCDVVSVQIRPHGQAI